MINRFLLVWATALGLTLGSAMGNEIDPWVLSGDLFETESLSEMTITLDEAAKIKLKVTIANYPEDNHPDFTKTTEKTSDGMEFETFLYKGKKLAPYQYPGGTYVSEFSLTWDGKAIPVPKMFWDDLHGVFAQQLKLLRKPASPAEEFAMQTVDDTLYRPRLSLSSSNGTLLISWKRPEE